MTTKRQAEICVERNLSDDEIVTMTGCHPECVEFVRAWGRGERVMFYSPLWSDWIDVTREDVSLGFGKPSQYRIAPRRIHVKAIGDEAEREASFPQPMSRHDINGAFYVAHGDCMPERRRMPEDAYPHKELEQGRVFRTRDEALERDKAMIWISGGEVE